MTEEDKRAEMKRISAASEALLKQRGRANLVHEAKMKMLEVALMGQNREDIEKARSEVSSSYEAYLDLYITSYAEAEKLNEQMRAIA